MKLSNKLLLGTVLVVMLIVLLHYAGLAFMRSQGWYTEKHEPGAEVADVFFYPENIRVVRINNCSDVQFYSGEKFRYGHSPYAEVKTATKGDTLILEGKYAWTDTIIRKGKIVNIVSGESDYSGEVGIYLTGRERIEGIECGFRISYPHQGTRFQHLEMALDDTEFEVLPYMLNDTAAYAVHIRNLSLEASKNSRIDFRPGTVIDSLHLSLQDSSRLQSEGAQIKTGTLYYSDGSGISTGGANLKGLQLVYRKEENPKQLLP